MQNETEKKKKEKDKKIGRGTKIKKLTKREKKLRKI